MISCNDIIIVIYHTMSGFISFYNINVGRKVFGKQPKIVHLQCLIKKKRNVLTVKEKSQPCLIRNLNNYFLILIFKKFVKKMFLAGRI